MLVLSNKRMNVNEIAIQAVIFDLDGTITEPYFDFDAIRLEMGLDKGAGPVWEAMQKMTPQQRKKTEQILDFHERQALEQARLNPGTKETLEELYQQGIKIGILTRNKKDNAMEIAEKFGLHFDHVVDRYDGPVKPDAFGVLTLCHRFGIEPAHAMMVGDYLFDIQSGKSAGAVTVFLKNRKNKNFSDHADYTIYNMTELLELIKTRNDQ